jgi:hypothetical protein
MKLLLAALTALALLPATAVAQTPPPDERAAAQAFADAAKRLLAAADSLDGDPGWLEDCRALNRVPERKQAVSAPVIDSLVFRDLVDALKPDVFRLRSDLANAQTLDAALISGRAAVRRLGRAIEAIPPGEADPCAAFVHAGYPRSAARKARALQRRIDTLVTRGMQRRVRAAAARIAELGVSRADADAFGQLAEA